MESATKNNEELKDKDQGEQAQGQEQETAEQPDGGNNVVNLSQNSTNYKFMRMQKLFVI